MDHAPRSRATIPRLQTRFDVFSETELVAYLIACDVRVVEFRGALWRNSYAPSPISTYAWTPVNRWAAMSAGHVGYPTRSALAYRALATEPVTTTFGQTIFRDLNNLEQRMSRRRATYVRQALRRFEYVILQTPDVLLAEGWQVMRDAYAHRGAKPPVGEASYRRQMETVFAGKPPVIVAALTDGKLAGFMTSYAMGLDATLERLCIAPAYRASALGLGLYWVVLTGWAAAGVRDVWAGATLPGGVDRFKLSVGAVLEEVPVHAGMRAPVRLGYRILKPDALSLTDLRA